ncbi:hypothetical protein [Merismopedia glauca]|uniref:Type IV secretion system protein VirB4 n=1 Tax=Merismopedia glauca CCAP 1448/3 TaxID=1296344 RepID=A0A2T1C3I5_9CYAN|nr:hypothetical protein [Merismopedia glauca]PSB02764.1 hypothetical protein C7B64_11470 [Merismopedia glauca CCAP 1448/3]
MAVKNKVKPRVKRVKERSQSGQNNTFVPFENYLDLVAVVDFQVEDRSIGAYLLQKNDQWRLIFGFEYVPFHSTPLEESGSQAFWIIQEALKEILPGESLRWVMGCYRDDSEAQAKLQEMGSSCTLPVARLLLKSQQKRIAELTTSGQRKVWRHYVFASYTLDPKNSGSKPTFWAKAINYALGLFNSLKGSDYREEYRSFLIDLLNEAFFQGFERWQLILAKAGIKATPLPHHAMWNYAWQKFHHPGSTPEPCPHVLIFHKQGGKIDLEEFMVGSSHICTSLIQADACPKHKQMREAVFVKGKYCATLVLDVPHRDFGTPDRALVWLWNKLSGELVYDTELYAEITKVNVLAFQDNLDRLSNHSRANISWAAQKAGARNVRAETDFENVLDAQKELYSGAIPIKLAFVLVVYRDSLRDLDKACALLKDSFDTSKFSRNTETCWSSWLDTLPFNLRRLLASSSLVTERRPTVPSEVLPALLPLAAPRDIDSEGVEFISFKGGKPLFVNPFGRQAENVLILGQRGSGKSVLFNHFVFQALAQGIPGTIIDIPGKNGSTYKPLVEALGEEGAYYDTSRSSLNFMEPPDLRGFTREEREYRMTTWRAFPQAMISAISMAGLDDPALNQRVDTLVAQILDIFLSDSEIIARYNAAFAGGWKSQAWQDIPTFRDFLKFATKENLNLDSFGALDDKALNQIQVQGKSLLIQDSLLGRHLCRPSSCSPTPQLIVFAIQGLISDYEFVLAALNVQAACSRISLSHTRSFIGYDEISVLFRYAPISLFAAQRSATSRKDGVSLIFAGQDPNQVLSAAGAPQIMQSVQYKFIGRLEPTGAEACHHSLGFPKEIISHNISEDFMPNFRDFSTQWLFTVSGQYWFVRYFACQIALGLGANNPDEIAARERIRQKYDSGLKGNILALGEYSRLLCSAYADGVRIAS